jgi:hypothetical protein
MGAISAVSFGEAGFKPALEEGQDEGHNPIKDCGGDERFKILEFRAPDFLRAPQ